MATTSMHSTVHFAFNFGITSIVKVPVTRQHARPPSAKQKLASIWELSFHISPPDLACIFFLMQYIFKLLHHFKNVRKSWIKYHLWHILVCKRPLNLIPSSRSISKSHYLRSQMTVFAKLYMHIQGQLPKFSHNANVEKILFFQEASPANIVYARALIA